MEKTRKTVKRVAGKDSVPIEGGKKRGRKAGTKTAKKRELKDDMNAGKKRGRKAGTKTAKKRELKDDMNAGKKRGRKAGTKAAKAAVVVEAAAVVPNKGVKVIRKSSKLLSKLSVDDGSKRECKLKRLQSASDISQTIEFINGVPDDHIPYVLATVINNREMTKNYQENIRMEMMRFLKDNFQGFCEDFNRLEKEPALRMRLFIELSKLVLARPKITDDADMVDDSRDAMIRRMFGLSR